jgi:hypothetical protein
VSISGGEERGQKVTRDRGTGEVKDTLWRQRDGQARPLQAVGYSGAGLFDTHGLRR